MALYKRHYPLVLTLAIFLMILTGCAGTGAGNTSKIPRVTNMKLHWDQWGRLFDDKTLIGSVFPEVPSCITAAYNILPSTPNAYQIMWKLIACEDIDSVRMALEFICPRHADYWMIPAVSYNGNEWGDGKSPTGAMQDSVWRTWSYKRTAIAGTVYAEGGDYAVATLGYPPSSTEDEFSCGIKTEDTVTTHMLVWPEEEMPVSYCGPDKYSDGWRTHVSMKKGDVKIVYMYIYVDKRKPGPGSLSKLLAGYWNIMPHPSMKAMKDDSLWRSGIAFCKKSLWTEDGKFSGFSSGLVNDNGEWVRRPDIKYETGWTGQNISIACSLLWDYIIHKDDESLEKGLKTLDCWARYCPLPNGLFVTRFENLNNVRDYVIDAVNLADAASGFFRAYDFAEKCGYDKPEYARIATDICDFILNDQQDNGCYGRGWAYDGTCVFRDGTSGCSLVYPMLEAYLHTSDNKYLLSAQKAFDYYFKQLSTDGYSTAGALDSWCIDKESAIPLTYASYWLCKTTGKRKYLDAAIQVSYYISTWLWHYDIFYPEDDELTKFGYHSFGATSVSVQQHYLDCGACILYPIWKDLAQLSGDSQWSEKADAIWANCCQFISDGNLTVNGMVRPAGSQNEAVYNSTWRFDGDSQHQRTNDILSAWQVAFRLKALIDVGYNGKRRRQK